MGWWREEGTENTIGDLPLDALRDAVASVVDEYQREFGRPPTSTEWEALLGVALTGDKGTQVVVESRVVKKVTLEVEARTNSETETSE